MPKRPIQPEDLLKIQFVSDAQISPDGRRVLFAKKHIGEKNKSVTNLFSVDLPFVGIGEGSFGVARGSDTSGPAQANPNHPEPTQTKPKQWTSGEGGNSHGRWSPDGRQIAFISGREKPCSQIFLIDTDGGEARPLTKLEEGSIGGFRWSPDGRWIAFTYRPQHADWTEKAKKEREEKGLSTPPRELESVWYRLDGDGYFLMQRYAIWIVEVATGEARELYAGDPALGNYSFDWSPDSEELAVIHTANKRPWAEVDNDQIYRVSLDGQVWQLPGLPNGEKSAVRWSPDGQWLAYVGNWDPNDPRGVRNNQLYVVPAGGGEPRSLTAKHDYCMTASVLGDSKEASFDAAVEWAPSSKRLFLSVGHHGASHLGFVELEGDWGLRFITSGAETCTLSSISRDGSTIAGIWGDSTHLSEVAVWEARSPDLQSSHMPPSSSQRTMLTTLNKPYHDEIVAVEPEEIWLDSTDGVKVQAWVMMPVGYLAPKRYPAVLEIHGGPHAMYGCTYFHEFQVLAAQGYVVVYSNPRGSKGYGEDHTAAIRGAWGKKDWEDIQTVTRWMQHQPYIHPGRMGVMGGSYGGYMTNWVVGHCRDYKAAITDRCVSNLVSQGGNSDFPMRHQEGYWKGYPWGDLEKIRELWEQSPISYFDHVETPMLIIHSEGDLRCNIEQSEEVFAALQVRGVESRFVRYPQSSSHGMSRSGPPDLRIHRLKEIVRWWEKHLG